MTDLLREWAHLDQEASHTNEPNSADYDLRTFLWNHSAALRQVVEAAQEAVYLLEPRGYGFAPETARARLRAALSALEET